MTTKRTQSAFGAEADSRLDEPGQIHQDHVHLGTHQPQKQSGWSPFGQSGFADCYIHEEAHLLIKMSNRNGQEFLAYVQRDSRRLPSAESYPTSRTIRDDSRLCSLYLRRYFVWAYCAARIYEANGQQQTMLVDVVQSLEGEKVRVPSLVWLDTAERFNRILMRSFYHSQNSDFPVCGSFQYREFCAGRDLPTTGHHHPAGHIVQCTTEAMQNITDNERYVPRDHRNILDAIRYVAGLGILLDSDGAWITLPPDVHSSLQLSDVLLGPLLLR